MTDRLYRSYSPSRDEGGRPTPHRPVAEGMVGAANQGAVAFGSPPDYRLQTAQPDWTEEEQ